MLLRHGCVHVQVSSVHSPPPVLFFRDVTVLVVHTQRLFYSVIILQQCPLKISFDCGMGKGTVSVQSLEVI